jgi:hypothetical protein
LIAEKFLNPIIELVADRRGYLPYQTIAVVRRVAVSLFIAAAQIAPQFQRPMELSDSSEHQQQVLNQLLAVTHEVDSDSQRMLNLETTPFLGDEALETRLKSSLTSWLVQNEIRNTTEVQSAIRRVVEKKNQEHAT